MQPILPSTSLVEIQVKLEEVQRRLQVVQGLKTRNQVLLSVIQGLSQGVQKVEGKVIPLTEIEREIDLKLAKQKFYVPAAAPPADLASRRDVDLLILKVGEMEKK